MSTTTKKTTTAKKASTKKVLKPLGFLGEYNASELSEAKKAKPAAKKAVTPAAAKAFVEKAAAAALKTIAAKPAAKKTTAKKAEQPAAKATGKGATILALIQRKGGATATELQTATGWQAHSVRGFLSIATKKGTPVTSAKREDGQRVYSA